MRTHLTRVSCPSVVVQGLVGAAAAWVAMSVGIVLVAGVVGSVAHGQAPQEGRDVQDAQSGQGVQSGQDPTSTESSASSPASSTPPNAPASATPPPSPPSPTSPPPVPPAPSQQARWAQPPPSPPPADIPYPPTAPLGDVGPRGRVLRYRNGSAEIDLGTTHKLAVGDRVQFYRITLPGPGTLMSSDGREAIEPVAIGVVQKIRSHQATVALPIGWRVQPGDVAHKTYRFLMGDPLFPPRFGGIWEFKATARALWVVSDDAGDDGGMGIMSDFSIGYRFNRPWFVRAYGEPFGAAKAANNTLRTGLVALMAGLDFQSFEVGLGAGWATTNAGFDRGVNEALALTQAMRIGPIDGLHLYLQNAFGLTENEFGWLALTGTLQIPVADAAWLIARGGGGNVGYSLGELGLRMLLNGNGDRGSWFVTPYVGATEVFETRSSNVGLPTANDPTGSFDTTVSFFGPHAGLGLELRL
jgi:hypothetical protein